MPGVAKHESNPGRHVDFEFFKSIRTELEKIHSKRGLQVPEVVKAFFDQWAQECNCTCGSEDIAHSDVEDFNYCPHGDCFDQRTFGVLEPMIPTLRKHLPKQKGIIDQVVKKAAESRQRFEAKQELVSKWLDDAEEASEYGTDSDSPRSIPLALESDSLHVVTPRGLRLTDLPLDLLIDILLLARSQDCRAPTTFSQVSSACRGFAISTPILWTIIDFGDPLDLVQLLFSRSSDLPLEIRVDTTRIDHSFRVDYQEVWTSRLDGFIAALSPHHHRVARLFIKFEGSSREDAIATFMNDSAFKNLQFLQLQWADNIQGWPVRALCLREVSLVPSSPSFTPRLTSLTLSDYKQGLESATHPLSAVLGLLSNTPSLVRLTFEDFGFSIGPAGYQAIHAQVALPELAELNLLRVGDKSMREILEHIQTPSLRLLSIIYQPDIIKSWYRNRQITPRPIPFKDPLLDIAPSIGALERLDMACSSINPEELAKVLQSLRSLKNLRITSSDLTAEHLAALRVNCPNLAHLTIENELTLTTSSILTMVETKTGSSIRSLVLRGWDASNAREDDVRRIRELVPTFVPEVFLPYVYEKSEVGSSDGWQTEEDGADEC